MSYKIVITERAEMDLRGIFEYIAYTLLAKENAAKQLDRLEKRIMELREMPERFQLFEHEPWKSRGLRKMPVDNYCVLYFVDLIEHIVTIVRVLYRGRDMETALTE